MDYREAVAALYALTPRGIRLGLDHVRDAVRAAQIALPRESILIAGTNGKGSTAAMIERALIAENRRVGLYTSPHLHRFVERIRIDGEPIAEAELARLATRHFAREGLPELSFFETATLLAFEAFEDVDVAVLEVGLGGRLDATNVVAPRVSVITNIALDHTAMLGPDIASIAREKAGVMRPGVPVVIGASGEGRDVLLACAHQVGAIARLVEPVEGEVGLPGVHQRVNAACAAEALRCLRVSEAAIEVGLAHPRWPGRLERITNVLFDAAHNPDGAAALASHLASVRERPRVLVFGCMQDKDAAGMLGALARETEHRIYCAPAMERAARPESLAAIVDGELENDVVDALERAKSMAGADGLVVVAGSIFVVAAARAYVLGIEAELPIGL